MSNSSKKHAAKDVKDVQEKSAQAPAQAGMPLFFSKPVLVTTDRHSDAGIVLGLPPTFASGTNSIPTTVGEFIEVAKHYPIVFTSDAQIIPLAITGLEQINYFIGENDHWKQGVYIPAYVRKYPFIFMENSEEDKLMLCVDEDSAHFVAKAEGKDVAKLYDNGEPTEFTRTALNFCAAVQEQHAMTRKFCDILKSLDLLQPNKSEAKLASGRTIRLSGFQLIDAEKLKQLPDEKILELHHQGWLPLIHYCILSGSNWRNLLEMAELREGTQENKSA